MSLINDTVSQASAAVLNYSPSLKQDEKERRKAEVRARMEEVAAQKKQKKGFMTPARKKKLRVSTIVPSNITFLDFMMTRCLELDSYTSTRRVEEGTSQESGRKSQDFGRKDRDTKRYWKCKRASIAINSEGISWKVEEPGSWKVWFGICDGEKGFRKERSCRQS